MLGWLLIGQDCPHADERARRNRFLLRLTYIIPQSYVNVKSFSLGWDER
jgi:hypothetical protein